MAKSADQTRRLGVTGSRPHPEIGPLHVSEIAREIDDDPDLDVLDRTCRSPADRRRDSRRLVLGDDDAGRTRPVRATAHRTEVVGIRHLVEAGDQRTLARGELVGIGVPVRLAEGDDALMVAALGQLVQLPLALHVDAKAALLTEPGLGRRAPARSREAPGSAYDRRASPPAPAGGRRPARGSKRDQVEAVGLVAHFPARRLDLLAQAIRLVELAAASGFLPLRGELDDLGRGGFLLGEAC